MIQAIELKRQEIAEVASQVVRYHKLVRLATSVAKQFKPTVADKLRRASDLARWLYVYEEPALALQVCRVLNDLPFENDYNRWTWIESTLSLEWKLCVQASELERAHACIAAIQQTYTVGSTADQLLKANALKNRLTGCLLRADSIAEAEQAGDKSGERNWRFIEIGELLFMQALSGSAIWSLLALEQQLSLNLAKLRS